MIVTLIIELILLLIMIVILGGLVFVFVSGMTSIFHGAPYVPVSRKLVPALLEFGGLSVDDIYYDLGSGDGRTLISAIRDFKVQHATGYEISSWPYMKSKWLTRNRRLRSISIIRGNFFSAKFSDATFIYAYLFPKLVDQLATKFEKELKNGTTILCPSFPIDLIKHPSFSLKKSDKIGTITAYLYEKI